MYEHYKMSYYLGEKGKVKRIRKGKEVKVKLYESEKGYYFFIIHNDNNKKVRVGLRPP